MTGTAWASQRHQICFRDRRVVGRQRCQIEKWSLFFGFTLNSVDNRHHFRIPSQVPDVSLLPFISSAVVVVSCGRGRFWPHGNLRRCALRFVRRPLLWTECTCTYQEYKGEKKSKPQIHF